MCVESLQQPPTTAGDRLLSIIHVHVALGGEEHFQHAQGDGQGLLGGVAQGVGAQNQDAGEVEGGGGARASLHCQGLLGLQPLLTESDLNGSGV